MAVSDKVNRTQRAVQPSSIPSTSSLTAPSTASAVPSTSTGKFSLNSYLTSKIGAGVPNTMTDALKERLRNIQNQERVDADARDFNIIQYWARKRFEDAELWRVVKVVLAAAATQCSVERDFSAFNNTFTKSRTNIKSENLQNVLKVKCNPDLLEKSILIALKNPIE